MMQCFRSTLPNRICAVEYLQVRLQHKHYAPTKYRTPKQVVNQGSADTMAGYDRNKQKYPLRENADKQTRKICRANYGAFERSQSSVHNNKRSRSAATKEYNDENDVDEQNFSEERSGVEQLWKSAADVRKLKRKTHQKEPPEAAGPLNSEEGDPQYKNYRVMQANDCAFAKLMIKAKSKEGKAEGLIVLEGRRLIAEALLTDCEVSSIFFSDPNIVKALPLVTGTCQLVKIDASRLKIWTDLATQPGIIAIAKRPTLAQIIERQKKLPVNCVPLTVICDQIRSPDNMGAVLRSVAAAGCTRVYATKGCVDVWGSKVLRGGMGAQFRVPVYTDLLWSSIRNHITQDFEVFLADSSSREIAGEVESFKTDAAELKVEASEEESSFDVAAASTDADADSFGTRSKTSPEPVPEQDLFGLVDVPLKNADKLQRTPAERLRFAHRARLPVRSYDEAQYFKQQLSDGGEFKEQLCLIVGGETGISTEARAFALERFGSRVHVPMGNGIECLNAATAFGIIAYEIRRQFRQLENMKIETVKK